MFYIPVKGVCMLPLMTQHGETTPEDLTGYISQSKTPWREDENPKSGMRSVKKKRRGKGFQILRKKNGEIKVKEWTFLFISSLVEMGCSQPAGEREISQTSCYCPPVLYLFSLLSPNKPLGVKECCCTRFRETPKQYPYYPPHQGQQTCSSAPEAQCLHLNYCF